MTLSKSHSQARTNLYKPQLLFLFSTFQAQNASFFAETDSSATAAIPDFRGWFTPGEKQARQHTETPQQNQMTTSKTSLKEKAWIQVKN